MMLRNILVVIAGLLVAILPAACGKQEAVENKNVTATLRVTVHAERADDAEKDADLKAAVVLINGKTYSAGSEIKLPAGEYVVVVEKEGFNAAWKKVTLEQGKATDLEVTLKENRTSVQFTTKEEGVEIALLQDDQLIKSGASPLYVPNLLPGNYTYTAEKQGFTKQTSPLTITNEGMTRKIQISLDNTIGFLELKITPADAVVYVDGKETAYSGSHLELPAGNYEVRVAKAGYEEQNGTIEIRKKQFSTLSFNLRQKKAKLSVKVEGHPDAIVKINGEVVNSPEKWQEVDAGKYKIEVTKEFYDKEEIEINLDPEQEEQVVISKLNRNTGSVRLKLDHPAVRISLNGKVIGMTQPTANGGVEDFVVEGLAIGGKYRFTFEHPNQFKSVTRSVTIKKEEKHVSLKVPFTIANATIKYKEGANRKAGKVYVKELSDTELEVTFPTTSGKGAYSEKIRKDEVIIDYLPPVSVDAEYKSSSYDLLKAAGK